MGKSTINGLPEGHTCAIPWSDVGFAERVKSEKAKRFWDQLAEDATLSATANYTRSKASAAYSVSAFDEDYKKMPHGEGEQFYTEDDKGPSVAVFAIFEYFWIILNLIIQDSTI